MNLMLNSIEAMKETGGIPTIKTGRDESGQVLISVSDTGVGIPAEGADEIFKAFFTTKPQGSGMVASDQPFNRGIAWWQFVGHIQRRVGHDVSFHSANRSRGRVGNTS